MSSSDDALAADAPRMVGPNIPPARENTKMTAGAIQYERRFTAKGYFLPASSIGPADIPGKVQARWGAYVF
jgi:hypothetical protein